MSFTIAQKRNTNHFASPFSGVGKRTASAAHLSKSFILYPKLITLLVVFTLVSLTARVYFSNQLAVSGTRVSIYEGKVESLTAENFQLENQISEKSSLSYIEAKATEMGMVKINKLEVIAPLTPVALKP